MSTTQQKRTESMQTPFEGRTVTGIIPPLLTPLSDFDTLDVAGMENLIERLLSGGVHGLFLLGTCGEGPSLSYRLRRELVERACHQIDERLPVLVGITDSSMAESIRMAEFAAEQGAYGVVLAPPFYHPITQDDLLRYLEEIADRIPIPMFLYNMPSHTKIVYEIETLRKIFDHPIIAGLKDSSGDMNYFAEVSKLIKPRKHLSLLIGPEHLLPESLRLGGHGGISGGAHLLPGLFVDIFEAYRKNDLDRLEMLNDRLQSLDRLYNGFEGATFLKTVKAALSIFGLCTDRFAPPMFALDDAGKEKVRKILDELAIDRSTLR